MTLGRRRTDRHHRSETDAITVIVHQRSEAPYDETVRMIQAPLQLGVGQSRAMATPMTGTTGDEDICFSTQF